MTHIYTNKIDELVKSNKIYRFNHELKDTTDVKRNENIKCILNKHETHVTPVKLNEIKMKEHISILKNLQYKKRWQDLKIPQKIDRIDKYIKDNNITIDQKDIDRLKEYVDTKLLKSDNIEYDTQNGCILNINIIKKLDNTYTLDDISKKKPKRVVKKKDN